MPSEGQAALSVTPDGWTLGLTVGPTVQKPRDALSSVFAEAEHAHPNHVDAIDAAHQSALLLVQGLIGDDAPVGKPVVISAYGHTTGEGYAVNVAVHIPPVEVA